MCPSSQGSPLDHFGRHPFTYSRVLAECSAMFTHSFTVGKEKHFALAQMKRWFNSCAWSPPAWSLTPCTILPQYCHGATMLSPTLLMRIQIRDSWVGSFGTLNHTSFDARTFPALPEAVALKTHRVLMTLLYARRGVLTYKCPWRWERPNFRALGHSIRMAIPTIRSTTVQPTRGRRRYAASRQQDE